MLQPLQESETVELKKSTSELKEAVESIVAILNKHKKGNLYFGIKNDGTVVGQDISETTLRKISKTISDQIEPQIYPEISIEIINEKPCVHVKFEGKDAPYFADRRAYMRVADENKKLSVRELERLFAKKKGIVSTWESEITEIPVNKASASVVREFVRRANESGRMTDRYENAGNVLSKLEVARGEYLLNAGQVLFSNQNSMEVQAAVFAGTDKITFLDIQNYKGTLFDLISKSEAYIKEHINWRADLSGSRRVEIPEIPVRAIREAVINSLCHRDFTNPKGNEVAIFKDRVEIYNPGSFPDDHSPDEYINGAERSILRNPLIANAFFLTSDIERWGSGIRRIYEACKEARTKVTFTNLKTGFLVTFFRKSFDEAQIRSVEGLEDMLPEWSEKWSEKWSELTEKQQRILELIQSQPKISRASLAKELGIYSSAIQKHLETLKEKGLLHRVGPDKGGRWEVAGKP